MKAVLFLAFSAFIVGIIAIRENADPILEWHFNFSCDDFVDNQFFTRIRGISNQNEWECERFTTPLGRETTSCLPSQMVVKPLFLERVLTRKADFWDWRDVVANGQLYTARTNCTIKMFTRDYSTALEYVIFNAWPASIEIEPHGTMIPPGADEDNGAEPEQKALLERVTLIHEGIAQLGLPFFVIFEVDAPFRKRDAAIDEEALRALLHERLGLSPGSITFIGSEQTAFGTRWQLSVELGSTLSGLGAWLDGEGNIHLSTGQTPVADAVKELIDLVEGLGITSTDMGASGPLCLIVPSLGFQKFGDCVSCSISACAVDADCDSIGPNGLGTYCGSSGCCLDKLQTSTVANDTPEQCDANNQCASGVCNADRCECDADEDCADGLRVGSTFIAKRGVGATWYCSALDGNVCAYGIAP